MNGLLLIPTARVANGDEPTGFTLIIIHYFSVQVNI